MNQAFPLIGQANELERISAVIRAHKPLLILGPAGSGKSALLSAVLARAARSEKIVCIPYCSILHHLLIDLARALLEAGHGTFESKAKPPGDPEKWLLQQTSAHLKGLLWESLEAEPRTIILDGITGASFPTYRFLQRLYFAKGLGLVVSSRGPESLGSLTRLFWDPRNMIHLRPLPEEHASRLFDLAVIRFGLGHLDLGEFREKVLRAAKGNPGQILEMCRLAANPIYITGSHIKFAPLRIDALLKFL